MLSTVIITNDLCVLHFNARSLHPKLPELRALREVQKPDMKLGSHLISWTVNAQLTGTDASGWTEIDMEVVWPYM